MTPADWKTGHVPDPRDRSCTEDIEKVSWRFAVETCPRCGCVFGSHRSARMAELEAKVMSQNTIIEALNVVIEQAEADLARHIETALDTNEALYKAEEALARKTQEWQNRLSDYEREFERAEQAEEALAERDSRQCDGCSHGKDNHTYFPTFWCHEHQCQMWPHEMCSRWTARAEEGRE